MGAAEDVMEAVALLRVASSEDPDVRALCVRALVTDLDDRYERMTSAVADPLRERDLASVDVSARVFAHPGTDLVTVELTADAFDRLAHLADVNTAEGYYGDGPEDAYEDGYGEGLEVGRGEGRAEALADVGKLATAA